jgi:hypothetical protein
MKDEQVTTRIASCTSQRSTECTARFSGSGSHPRWRPASVAWIVAHDRLLDEPRDRDGALRHQPVVGVDHVRTPSAHERQRGANQRVLERLRPGQQALGGEVQVDRIDGCAVYVDALVRAVAQPGAAAADDAHLVTGCRELGRECADMPPETADDQRRILP